MSNKRPRRRQRQIQQLIFKEQEQQNPQPQPQPQQEQEQKQEQKQQEEEPKPKEEQEFTIIIRDGYCVRERKLLKSKSNPYSVYKIEHNVWFNRARRRWKKSEYFSERA
jgi:hypothetical protein